MALKQTVLRGDTEPPKKSSWKGFWNFLIYASAVILGVLSPLAIKEFTKDLKPERLVKYNIPPKFWGLDNSNSGENLRTIDRVFNRLGFSSVNGSTQEWDVLWSIEYPFDPKNAEIYNQVSKALKPHQRVNHFPGITYITSKSDMSTGNRDVKEVLPAFKFPEMTNEFNAYMKANPNARFVEKSVDSHGVKLVEAKEMLFKSSNKFYQLFMDKPLLIDGRALEFSVFFLISSLDPIRIYRYDHEINLRFCLEPYHPFDAKNINKYVASNSKKIHDMPSLKGYHDNFGYSAKLSVEDFLRKQGFNVAQLWEGIDKAGVKLILNNEQNLLKETLKVSNSSRNFFELVRIDFLLNDKLSPFINEVKMSPSLNPSDEVAQKITNEQIVHNTLKLVGAGSKLDLFSSEDTLANEMVSNSKNIAVYPNACLKNNCYQNCVKKICELCTTCAGEENLQNIHRAFREHARRGEFKRIFPTERYFDDEFMSKLSPKNQLAAKWFHAKCQQKKDWC